MISLLDKAYQSELVFHYEKIVHISSPWRQISDLRLLSFAVWDDNRPKGTDQDLEKRIFNV